MYKAVLSLAALVACEPFHRSVAYQESLHVIARETVPGKGTYDIFTDGYEHCHVDFEADSLALSAPVSPVILAPLSFPPAADLFRKQALLEEYCPDGYSLALTDDRNIYK